MLLIKKTGGSFGGGSKLTSFAEMILEKFGDIQKKIEDATDLLIKEELGDQLNIDNQFRDNSNNH